MGFQDRGYLRHDQAASFGEWTGVGIVIAINVGAWLLNFILCGGLVREVLPLQMSLNDMLCLDSDLPRHLPLHAWELLTYGFLHDGPSLEYPGPFSPLHLLFNMLTLWFFGREVEGVTGRAEFLRFYCTSIVVAGIAWVVAAQFGGQGGRLVGASGGVMAVLALFIWYFPRQTVLLWGVLPVPAWALGVLYFFFDLQGAATGGGNVAHVAHLAGAVFGILYAWRNWDLAELAAWPQRMLRRRRMRVVRPDDDRGPGGRQPGDDDDDETLQQTVDRILEKISRTGAAGLSQEERDTLTRASRRLKERVKVDR